MICGVWAGVDVLTDVDGLVGCVFSLGFISLLVDSFFTITFPCLNVCSFPLFSQIISSNGECFLALLYLGSYFYATFK